MGRLWPVNGGGERLDGPGAQVRSCFQPDTGPPSLGEARNNPGTPIAIPFPVLLCFLPAIPRALSLATQQPAPALLSNIYRFIPGVHRINELNDRIIAHNNMLPAIAQDTHLGRSSSFLFIPPSGQRTSYPLNSPLPRIHHHQRFPSLLVPAFVLSTNTYRNIHFFTTCSNLPFYHRFEYGGPPQYTCPPTRHIHKSTSVGPSTRGL